MAATREGDKAVQKMKQEMVNFGKETDEKFDFKFGAKAVEMALGEDKEHELDHILPEAFSLFDKNHDGFLTSDELVGIFMRPVPEAEGGGAPSEAKATTEAPAEEKKED